MKRLMTLLMALSMIALMLAGCGGSSGSASTDNASSGADSSASDETYVLKVALIQNEGDSTYDAVKLFCDEVEANSNGRITCEIYPGSRLGDAEECLEGLNMRIDDVFFGSVCNLASYSELANIDSVPYMYDSYEHFRTVWDSELGQSIKTTIGEESNMVLLGSAFMGARITTLSKRVSSWDEMKGVKIRVPTIPIYLDTWEWMGANPTPLSGSEIFTAIQQGTVEGQENSYIDSANHSFYEVCPYVLETNHVYSTSCFVMDKTFYSSLSEDLQQVLADAAQTASEYKDEATLNETDAAKQEFIDAGCEIIEVDTADFAARFDGFLEEKYPSLVEWAAQIAEMAP